MIQHLTCTCHRVWNSITPPPPCPAHNPHPPVLAHGPAGQLIWTEWTTGTFTAPAGEYVGKHRKPA